MTGKCRKSRMRQQRAMVLRTGLFFAVQLGLLSWLPARSGAAETSTIPAAAASALPAPERFVQTADGYSYGLSVSGGFMVSSDSGINWEARNAGLPTKLVHPFGQAAARRLTSLGVDAARPERIVITTAAAAYLTEDRGSTWRRIAQSAQFSKNAFLTAAALSPWDRNTLLLGTSFNGIYETKDLGKTWSAANEGIKSLYRGAGFWEDIAALAYDPREKEKFILSCGVGKGVFLVGKDRQAPEALSMPNWPSGQTATDLNFRPTEENGSAKPEGSWLLDLGTAGGVSTFSWPGRLFQSSRAAELKGPLNPVRAARLEKAARRTALYLTAYHARGKLLDGHLAFMKKNGFNAIVVDLKDDFGYVTYDTRLPLPREIGAVRKIVDLGELLKKAKANGVYVIARLVVFKDQQLYNFANNKYAAWDRHSGQPWRHLVKVGSGKDAATVQGEYWVDPFSPEVWAYNIGLAEELQALGVDEIQFDYIRFPTDGDTSRIIYRYRQEGMEKPDALESFLSLARERLAVPISTDLYGFNCWYRIEAWTGQNLELLASYIDVVCPMFYPSHFPSDFNRSGSYLDWAKTIYAEGTARAYSIGGGKVLVRPYIQAFLLGGEKKMDKQTYEKYLDYQIAGTLAAPSSGYALWNAGCNYFMVTKPVIQPPAPAPVPAPVPPPLPALQPTAAPSGGS